MQEEIAEQNNQSSTEDTVLMPAKSGNSGIKEEGMRDENGRFIPGHPPHPDGGRKKGMLSITAAIRKRLSENPHLVDELVEYYIHDKDQKSLLWQMLDGRPRQDVTSGDEKLPTPILSIFADVQRHHSDKESGQSEEADTSGTGGNVGV